MLYPLSYGGGRRTTLRSAALRAYQRPAVDRQPVSGGQRRSPGGHSPATYSQCHGSYGPLPPLRAQAGWSQPYFGAFSISQS